MLEHKPHHIRRKIAFLCTAVIAVVLLVLLIAHYSASKPTGSKESTSRIRAFYTTVLNNSQSLFDQK